MKTQTNENKGLTEKEALLINTINKLFASRETELRTCRNVLAYLCGSYCVTLEEKK
jgi:hypothetical protein